MALVTRLGPIDAQNASYTAKKKGAKASLLFWSRVPPTIEQQANDECLTAPAGYLFKRADQRPMEKDHDIKCTLINCLVRRLCREKLSLLQWFLKALMAFPEVFNEKIVKYPSFFKISSLKIHFS